MTYAPAAPEFERLPWLTDDRKPVPAPARRTNPLVLWSIFALLLIAGASYWLGMTSNRSAASDWIARGAATATMALPEPDTGESDLDRPVMPQVEPVAPPPPVTNAEERTAAERRSAARRSTRSSAAKSASADDEESGPAQLWPETELEGSAGRIVRIGTFGSRLSAKRGWRRIMQTYPGMERLKAVVVPSTSLRNGETYYRLQFGTTSQAHSAVLCQWMRSVAQSCIIIQPAAEAEA